MSAGPHVLVSLRREFIAYLFRLLAAAGIPWLIAASLCAVFILPSALCVCVLFCVPVSKLPLPLSSEDICDCI